MKYRKLPVEIEAVQFTGDLPYPDGVEGLYRDPMYNPHYDAHLDPKMVLDVDFKAERVAELQAHTDRVVEELTESRISYLKSEEKTSHGDYGRGLNEGLATSIQIVKNTK